MIAFKLDSDPSSLSTADEKIRFAYLEYAMSVICGPNAAEAEAYEARRKVAKTSMLLLNASTQQKQALPRSDKGLWQAHRNPSCGFFSQAKVNGRNAP
jgi:hypothetical protein